MKPVVFHPEAIQELDDAVAFIYEELSDRIWIDAVAHERRHPDYWKSRKPQD